MRPGTTLIVGQVVVIHPSTGKLLTLVREGALGGQADLVVYLGMVERGIKSRSKCGIVMMMTKKVMLVCAACV